MMDSAEHRDDVDASRQGVHNVMLPLRQVRQLGAGGECMATGPAEAEQLMHLPASCCGASDDVNEGSLHAAEGRRPENGAARCS